MIAVAAPGFLGHLPSNSDLGVNLELQAVKSKIKGVFTCCTVAMVTYFAMRLNHLEASLPHKTPVICLESGLVTFHRL